MTLQRVEINKQKSEGMICQIFLLGLRPKWRSRLTRVYNLQFGWVLGKYLHYIWLDIFYTYYDIELLVYKTAAKLDGCVCGGGPDCPAQHLMTVGGSRRHDGCPTVICTAGHWTTAHTTLSTREHVPGCEYSLVAGLHPNIKIRTICMIFKGLLDSPLKLTLIHGLVLPSLHASKLVSFIARWRIQVEVICVSFDWVAALNIHWYWEKSSPEFCRIIIRVAVAVTRRAQQQRRRRTAGAVLTRNLWRNCAPAYKFYCQDAIEREENAELVAIIRGHYRGRVGRAVRPGPGHAASGCCRAAGGGLGAAARASGPSAPDNEEQIYYNGRMEPCCSENILQKFCFCMFTNNTRILTLEFFGLLWCTVSASPFSLFFSLFGAIDFSVLKVKFCVLNWFYVYRKKLN